MRIRLTGRGVVLLWVLVALAGSMLAAREWASARLAGSGPQVRPEVRAALPDVPAHIRALLEEANPAAREVLASGHEELRDVYDAGQYAALWLSAAGGPNADASAALAMLRDAASEGLDPGTYRYQELERLARALQSAASSGPADLARFDVMLTAGVLRYLRHLHLGRVSPIEVGFNLTEPAEGHDFPSVLREAVLGHRLAATAEELRPALAEYAALRAALARYRALAADETLALPPAPPAAVRPGDSYEGVAALHRILVTLGDIEPGTPAPAASTWYEGALVEGVRRFQIRHGLEVDGILGRQTLAALTVPLSWRVRQIELSLERLRWLPDFDERPLVLLNIPMFRLWAWDAAPPNGLPSFATDVIVGRALRTQTPVFVEEMREVIFRPYWNVPSSIVRHEILPALSKDPGYLHKHAMEIVEGGGDRVVGADLDGETLEQLRQGRLRVRQRPGPQNSLGLVKFVFPNDENVYMHGTPGTELFARNRRDFSHGCVRVQDPVGLAEWVLRSRPEWSRDRILSAMDGARPTHVALERPIQVILFYTTAAVTPEDGVLRFAEDIYGHDARLDRALAPPAGQKGHGTAR